MPYVVGLVRSGRDPYSYIEFPPEEHDEETGGGFWFSALGGPIEEELLPKRTLKAVKRSKKKDPEFTFAYGSQPCVTEKVKAIIERFEPGVHQFFPVEINSPNGTVLERGRYMLNVTTLVDAIADGKNHSSDPGDPRYSSPSTCGVPLSVRHRDIAGLHLWRDERIAAEVLFMSTELFDALNDVERLRVVANPLILV
ncbi:hypothetical protein PQJ75_08955 [Rhodoplanes sp. TEM]|uniref:Immunity MXAN-0049 protein domain-containing protein n=1 Tax=Rhodoplanes tepidamans TaxID=200616 RepID=A0ABT5JJF8_RHOTP|nr:MULTISPECIES: DUF1629 domain-containing protein [Rhodoplanes]MDC7789667.1 hypothetical protein [Rhodoplanes tepidamans]MDC7983856.1 hypothetical protein [Rhodoplanes sp. TEM]MDQ0359134.1 hypothetical protein [Rhodoplanes tepidamans]